MTHINKHGVECVRYTTGVHFGREVKQASGKMVFQTNLPVDVPVCCTKCPFFDRGEYGEMGTPLSGPGCNRGLFFPTQKGTCKVFNARNDRARDGSERG